MVVCGRPKSVLKKTVGDLGMKLLMDGAHGAAVFVYHGSAVTSSCAPTAIFILFLSVLARVLIICLFSFYFLLSMNLALVCCPDVTLQSFNTRSGLHHTAYVTRTWLHSNRLM